MGRIGIRGQSLTRVSARVIPFCYGASAIDDVKRATFIGGRKLDR